jgi:hypothetical protein
VKFTEEQKMATVREHLEKFHSEMSKCHTAAMDKGAEPEFHKAAAAVHDAFKEACAKATADDLNKLVPLPHGFSRLAPDNPNRAVPRHGAPPLQKAVVDEEFAHLISSGDDRTE